MRDKGSDWRPMKDAPKDGTVVLLWGKLCGPSLTEWHPLGKIRVVGCWNEIDYAWALSSMPWNGPFFEPVCWAEIPDAPCMQLERMLEADNEALTRISDSE